MAAEYKSIFEVEKDEFKLIVSYKATKEIVAASEFIPDPRFPRYEILNKDGITVAVELEEPKAHKLLAQEMNIWLQEKMGTLDASRKSTSKNMEK